MRTRPNKKHAAKKCILIGYIFLKCYLVGIFYIFCDFFVVLFLVIVKNL